MATKKNPKPATLVAQRLHGTVASGTTGKISFSPTTERAQHARALANRAIQDITNRKAYCQNTQYRELEKWVKNAGDTYLLVHKAPAPWLQELISLAKQLQATIARKWSEAGIGHNLEEGYDQSAVFEQLAEATVNEVRSQVQKYIQGLGDKNGIRGVTKPKRMRLDE